MSESSLAASILAELDSAFGNNAINHDVSDALAAGIWAEFSAYPMVMGSSYTPADGCGTLNWYSRTGENSSITANQKLVIPWDCTIVGFWLHCENDPGSTNVRLYTGGGSLLNSVTNDPGAADTPTLYTFSRTRSAGAIVAVRVDPTNAPSAVHGQLLLEPR